MKKKTFLFFHLNILYSSIDEVLRKKIILDCYYPILKIAQNYNIPINIEASARTLQEIERIDKKFIPSLKKLIKENKAIQTVKRLRFSFLSTI